jgi:hypothetical protein
MRQNSKAVSSSASVMAEHLFDSAVCSSGQARSCGEVLTQASYHDWRTKGESLDRVSVRECQVSFFDRRGIRHAVTVQASSVLEAAGLGLKRVREQEMIDDDLGFSDGTVEDCTRGPNQQTDRVARFAFTEPTRVDPQNEYTRKMRVQIALTTTALPQDRQVNANIWEKPGSRFTERQCGHRSDATSHFSSISSSERRAASTVCTIVPHSLQTISAKLPRWKRNRRR